MKIRIFHADFEDESSSHRRFALRNTQTMKSNVFKFTLQYPHRYIEDKLGKCKDIVPEKNI